MSREEYISKYADDAVREMQKSGVPASITLAQACLESGDGNSQLAKEANNHFGIKCADWKGPGFYQDDDAPNECFRKYSNVFESFDDHSNFLRSRPRYASLFELEPTDYKGWAHGLKKAGYATDPQYAHRLIQIIEQHGLHRYDTESGAPIASKLPTVKNNHRNNSGKVTVPSVEPINVFSERSIRTNNGVPYVLARPGDTFKSIAEELQLGYWQLPKYNELPITTQLHVGQIIYIAPKKQYAETGEYTVQEGDDLHKISQQLGVKSKFISRKNGIEDSKSLSPGTRLSVGR
ncbi:MAG: glucosaminidase domain-containing protein [Bacteroidota bacterium]